MKTVIVLITIVLELTYSNGQENLINKGTYNYVQSQVGDYSFNFGSNWRGPSTSTASIRYNYDRVVVREFGEPLDTETFCFVPPGEITCIEIEFHANFETFANGEFTFGLLNNIDPRICPNIKKIIPTNIIRIVEGDPSCDGVYRYTISVRDRVDTADSNIEFIDGQTPRFIILNQVTSLDAYTYEGYLGTTFQSTVDGTKTIRINAIDIRGDPLSNIVWSFKAECSSSSETPASLAGVTIASVRTGRSELEIRGVILAHIGVYSAVATNEHGTDRASSFVTRGIAPYIIEGSGQSSLSWFRVGASKSIELGETISIRAEDAQSDPRSRISWLYSRFQSGPFSAISSGGPYSILTSCVTGNVGTESTLRISNVQAGRLGYYSAVATNEFGTYSSRVSLVGRVPRMIRGAGIATSGSYNIETQIHRAPGSAIVIRAFDQVGFPDSSYTWQRVFANTSIHQDITSGTKFQITSFYLRRVHGSTLIITGVTEYELGLYRVTASNGLVPDDTAESLVGLVSTCINSFSVIRNEVEGCPHTQQCHRAD